MKYLTTIALLAALAMTTAACSPRTTCTPVAMFREVPVAVPVLPPCHSARCFPAYADSCPPAYLPYRTEPRISPPLTTPALSCCFPQ